MMLREYWQRGWRLATHDLDGSGNGASSMAASERLFTYGTHILTRRTSVISAETRAYHEGYAARVARSAERLPF